MTSIGTTGNYFVNNLLFFFFQAKDNIESESTEAEEEAPVLKDLRQIRFNQFASIEYKGQFYMTALDFLDSVTDFELKGKNISIKLSCIDC